jgi:anti-anti-sigma regulatory factor
VKPITQIVLAYPCAAGAAGRRNMQKQLVRALRASELPVVIDLSECRNLDHQDIDTLLDCVEHSAGRDTPLFLAATSAAIRVLLEVTRIASLVRVFESLEEALAYPRMATVEPIRSYPSQLPMSA